jgi:hypothetical protein
MRPYSPLLFAFALAIPLAAQDVKLNVPYVCAGERMYVESCNIRDLSDTATCQVAHPDRPQHNGFMAYTSETRGSLKKLLPLTRSRRTHRANAFNVGTWHRTATAGAWG